MRSLPSQIRHDAMVQQLCQDLCAKGYARVSPAHGENAEDREPQKIYSEIEGKFFRPDIFAEKEGVPVYFEVETEDSIDSATTKAEIECFLSHAKKIRGYFYLVVPLASREKATALLRQIEHKDSHRSFVLTI